MTTSMRDVYLYVFDEYLTSTTDVAIAFFDEDPNLAESVLLEIVDAELLKQVGDDSWMATPNSENIEREEAVALSEELSGDPIYVYQLGTVIPEDTGLDKPVNKPKYLHPDRARENFQALIDNAPSPAALAYWTDKLAGVDS